MDTAKMSKYLCRECIGYGYVLGTLGYVLNFILLKNNILGTAWYALGMFMGWLSVVTTYIKMLSVWSQFFKKKKTFLPLLPCFPRHFSPAATKRETITAHMNPISHHRRMIGSLTLVMPMAASSSPRMSVNVDGVQGRWGLFDPSTALLQTI